MPNSVAEAYLLILRSSFVPVIGEAVPMPFMEQIELDEWHWELKYDEKANGGKGATTSPEKSSKPGESAFNGVGLIKAVQNMQNNSNYDQEGRNKRVVEMVKKATAQQAQADKEAADSGGDGAASAEDKKDADNKLTFTFKKNVDLATTQLLNSMKSGERMPRAVLTLFHRSVNAPVTFVVTFGNVVFTKYDLSVDPTDTMADMKESWTAIYETVDYVYQNRPAASGPNGVTKGTARVFKMKLKNLF
jgi:type VI protein secretion system component Hcp